MTDNFDIIKDFLTPKEIIVEEVNPNHSKIILEPLERGFGHTLGNALRRVLLSSMPGSAVTEVSIDNILHEYSTIDGVQEDVLEILLNIKKLALVLHDKDMIEVKLTKKGKGPVLASDIEDHPNLEIKNPNFCIANMTNEKTELVLVIFQPLFSIIRTFGSRTVFHFFVESLQIHVSPHRLTVCRRVTAGNKMFELPFNISQ